MKSRIYYLLSLLIFLFSPKISHALSSKEVNESVVTYIETNQHQQAIYLLILLLIAFVFLLLARRKKG